MTKLCLLVTAFLATGLMAAHSNDNLLRESISSQTYRDTLASILDSDQLYRTAISWGTTDLEELKQLEALDDDAHMAEWSRRNKAGIALPKEIEAQLWKKQNQLDQKNTIALMNLIREFGWPSKAVIDGTPYSPVPVLIHMRAADVEWVLPVLRAEVDAHRMPAKPYAMIFDRKRQHDGKFQIYGTMVQFDMETMSTKAPAIVNLEDCNRSRSEIGLEPLVEYRITDAATAAGK